MSPARVTLFGMVALLAGIGLAGMISLVSSDDPPGPTPIVLSPAEAPAPTPAPADPPDAPTGAAAAEQPASARPQRVVAPQLDPRPKLPAPTALRQPARTPHVDDDKVTGDRDGHDMARRICGQYGISC